jgi:hypothetical protein
LIWSCVQVLIELQIAPPTSPSNRLCEYAQTCLLHSEPRSSQFPLRKFICDKYKGVEYHEIALAFPESHDEIVHKTEAVIKEYNTDSAKPKRVRMVVVDSIASLPG